MWNGWQFISRQVVADFNYNKVSVILICYNNANTTQFGNIGLFRDEYGQSYTYDDNGNIVGVKEQAQQNSTFEYDGKDNLIKNINPRGGSFIYEYDSVRKNRLLKAINDIGQSYSFEYDEYGNITKSTLEGATKSDDIISGQTYYMKALSSDKYFDIEKGNIAIGANLEQWDLNYGNSQKFTFGEVEEGYFKIIPNHATDKVIYYNSSNENQIGQKPWSDGDEQKWKLIKNTDGTYRIISKENQEYCMTVKDDAQNNGEKIVIEKWEGKLNQHIILQYTTKVNLLEDNEVYYIKEKDSNLYMEMQSDTNGSGVILKKYSAGNRNQLWRIVKDQNDVYKLIPLGSTNGKALNVKGTVNNADQMTEMWDYLSSVSQQWKLEKTEKGTYKIMTNMAGTARGLTRYSNTLTEGTSICIYDIGNEFYLEKANLLDIESGATYKIKGKQSGLFLGIDSNNVLELQNESSTNQEWIIENQNDGYYKFRLKGNESQVMDVYNANKDNGTIIQIHAENGNDAQEFEIVVETDGTYYIKPKITAGKTSLNVGGSLVAVGSKIEHWSSGGWDSQKFELIKVESNDDRKYIETKAEYTENGNYQTKLIDTSMNETTYEYNRSRRHQSQGGEAGPRTGEA